MEHFTFERFMHGLRRQWWLVAQAVVVMAVVSGWYTARQPDSPFVARTAFLVQPELDVDGRVVTGGSNSLSGQMRLLLSDTVLGQTAAAAGVEIEVVRSMVSASVDSTAGVITVSAVATAPDEAVKIADQLVEAFVADRTAARSSSLTARQGVLETQLESTAGKINDLDEKIAEQNVTSSTSPLVAQRQALLAQYQTLFEQQQQVLTQIATQPKFIERLDLAKAVQKASPRVWLRALLGALLGLVVGGSIAVLREVLDRRLREPDQIGRATNLPVLAVLPTMKRSESKTVPMVTRPGGTFAESVRSLQTTIRFIEEDDHPVRVLAITSALGGDGKTTLAINLATSFALSGYSVVLVSADLRRATIDQRFGVTKRDAGLADLLAVRQREDRVHSELSPDDLLGMQVPKTDVSTVLRSTDVDGLKFLGAGSVTTQPAELLGSPQFVAVMEELRASFGMVILDCPPTLVADALLLGRVADATLVVSSVGRTSRPALEETVERLRAARVNLIGAVANRVGSPSARYRRYGYYGYYGNRSYYSSSRGVTEEGKVQASA